MASAPLKTPEPRVISLDEVSLSELEDLFDQQCAEWLELLRWDYTGPSRLIRETARERELSGFGALVDGRLIGFCYFVIEGNRCSIGDIYLSKRWRGIGADGVLAEALLDHLDSLPNLRRIESQCVNVDNHCADEIFVARGFHRFERHYMMRSVASLETGRPAAAEDPDISIRPWSDDDFNRAARIIHRSYRGEHDSRINSQYRNEEGCAELLTILTDHIWCGTFLARVSRVAIDRVTSSQVGVLIASRLSVGGGHIGQISILPAYQGRGIGRRMIQSAIHELAELGFEVASLAVTGANVSAFHLYQSCGFRTVHRFPVFYRDGRRSRPTEQGPRRA